MKQEQEDILKEKRKIFKFKNIIAEFFKPLLKA